MFDNSDGGKLCDVDPAGLSGDRLSAHVSALLAVRAQVEAALLAAVGEWDAQVQWAADAFVNGPTWLVHHGSMSRAEAGALVRDARRLRHHPDTASAIPLIGPARARVLLRAVNERTETAFERDEAMLVREAARLTVDDTKRMVTFWASHADPDGTEADAEEHRQRRRLHVSQYGDGNWRIDGELDPEAGLVVATAIDAVAEDLYRSQKACDDGTSPASGAQLRADALVELVHRGCATDPERSTPARPLIVAVMDLPTLERRAGRRCEIDDHGAITPDAAHRLACDANISRMITNGPSNVLDLGTATPTPNAAQRRALRARDGGCVVPGCDRPPGWCEAHHIIHRQDGGPTNLDDLCLLCRRHHHLHHNGQLGISRGATGHLTFTRPDGRPIHARPHPHAA